MPPVDRFISCAQNGEDVVLWRALGHIAQGRYVEVGANDPLDSSITRAFYDRGWSGLEIEPVTEFAEAFRRERPRDTVVQVAVTDAPTETLTMHVIEGTGLSTVDDAIAEGHRSDGWTTTEEVVPARRLDSLLAEHFQPDDDIHFMVVDTEGSEAAVLASVDLRQWRPWVLVVEATAPNSTRPTHEEWESLAVDAGYEFCLFDGLSRYYVAEEHADELRAALSVPANILDGFTTQDVAARDEEIARLRAEYEPEIARLKAAEDRLLDELIRWRGTVLERWANAATGSGSVDPGHEVVRLRKELADTRATVSWRATAPLRAVQARRLRGWR